LIRLLLSFLLILSSAISIAQPNPSAGEYFFGNFDPGVGAGKAFTVADGQWDKAVEYVLANDTIDLPPGTSILFNARMKDKNGNWGPTFRKAIFVSSANDQARDFKITQAEFYWGPTDPGQGSATPLIVYDGNYNDAIESVFEDTIFNAQTPDTFSFCIRVRDQAGRWGPIFQKTIFRSIANSNERRFGIQSAEYYLGSFDPGAGNGTTLLFENGDLGKAISSIHLDSILLNAETDTLFFQIRMKDAQGLWGPSFRKTIFRNVANSTNRNIAIQLAEFFTGNTDPGQGTGTPLVVFDGNYGDAIESIRFDALMASNNTDTLIFNIRLKDGNNQWGAVFKKVIFNNSYNAQNRDLKVLAAECFFGQMDPGSGNAMPLVIFNGNINDAIQSLLLTYSPSNDLNDTLLFQIRIQDINGNWGPTFKKVIFNDIATKSVRDFGVILSEWYTGSFDPGEGNGFPLIVFDGNWGDAIEQIIKDSLLITLQQDTILFNLRIKDLSGKWGPVFKKSLFVNQVNSASRDMNIQEAEYYLGFFDPGEGMGTPFLSADGSYGDIVENLLRTRATWDNPAGVALFNVRVKDAYGNWGPLFKKTVFISGENPTTQLIQEGDSAKICPEGSITLRYNGPNGYEILWFDGSNQPSLTFYPRTEGFYKVSASFRDSYYEDSIYIGFLASPPKNIQPNGNVLVCASSNLNLAATNDLNYTYQWRYNGTNIVGSTGYSYLPTQVGTYSVFMRHTQTGCTRLSDTVKLATNGFVVSQVVNSTNCLNGTSELQVAMGSTNTYQWQLNNSNISGATNPIYRPTTNGNYRVVIRNGSCVFNTPNYAYVLSGQTNFVATITPSTTQSICQGASVTFKANTGVGYTYQWKRNGINISFATDSQFIATQSGAYSVAIINSNGCLAESNQVTLTVGDIVTPTVSIDGPNELCFGQTITFIANATNEGANPVYNWLINGAIVQSGSNNAFSVSNVQSGDKVTCILKSSAACRIQDEILSNEISLNVTYRIQVEQRVTTCNSYLWNGITYTQSGTYTYSSSVPGRCDSSQTLYLTIISGTFTSTSQTACGSYTWNGQTYSNSGTYTRSYTNGNGCPSVDTLKLTINTGTFTSTTQNACGSYSWNGQTYSNSGTYTRSYTNGNGCPSLDTLNLTINTGTFTSTTQTACGSYTWNGQTYSNSGTYTRSYTNGNGCASVDTLKLNINSGTFTSTSQTACGSYTWNGQTYSNSGTYTRSYTNGNGCPSVDTLNLTINSGTFTSTSQTACGSYTWNGLTYSISGTYTRSYINGNGCPSVDTLNLTVNTGAFTSTTQTACGSYIWNGQAYSNSGTYTRSYTNGNGCPSVDTLKLTINTGTFTSTIQTACGSFTWNGQTYSNSGTYTRSYSNGNDCPSVDTLKLTINTGTFTSTTQTACGSYTWNGQAYSNSGTYTRSYSNGNGCPSVDTLKLTINSGTYSDTIIQSCGPVQWHGQTYTSSGIYTRNYSNGNGCPSVDTLHLTITPTDDYYWIGGVSTAWENPANWNCGLVPNDQSNVYVQSGAQRDLEVRSMAVCNRIYIRDGKKIRVITGYHLKVVADR